MTTPSDERALALPAFRLFLIARSVSWAGNAVTLVALPVLVFQLTGSPSLTGALAAIEAIPYLVFGLPAGALVDRWNRKHVLVVTGVASGVAMGAIPVVLLVGDLHVAYVFVVALFVATGFVFFDAAGFGALPELVGRERIASATGSMVAFSTVISLIGPAAGGLLIAMLGAAPALAIDAAAYLVAAGLTALVRWQAAPNDPSASALGLRALGRDMREGLAYLWRTRAIRWLTVIGAAASISGGAMLGLTVVVAVQQVGLAEDDPRLGWFYSATAAGAFLISLAVGWIQRRFGVGWITIGALAVSWAAQLAWAATTTIWIGLVVLAVFQAASTLAIMNGIIVRQSLAPDRLQSRVNTTARMIAWGGTPLGAALGGVLADRVGVSGAIVLCSLGTVLGIGIAATVRLWRVPRLSVLRAGALE